MSGMGTGQEHRRPAVAGMFYPGDAQGIREAVDDWLSKRAGVRRRWRAALVPHAGWIYSGRIAAQVLSQIEFPATTIILCPKHRAGGAVCAVAPWSHWDFPGGSIEADSELGERLAMHVSGFDMDHRPHWEEHAIEVQLPIIARVAPETRIVAITVGRIDLEDCRRIASDMADVVRPQLDNLLFVISSDMNHFATDAENRRLDAMALTALDQLDPEHLYATCQRQRISMCGLLPAVIVLDTLRQLDVLHRALRVDYATSAEVSGEDQRVVGYAGILFD